jgi:hypothetical protein
VSRQSTREKRGKQAKPIVKVPKGKVGRAVFVGSQVAGAVAIARAIKDARSKGDKLALLHGALSAAVLVVTALIAVRTVRAADAETTATESAEPLMLAVAER